MVLELYVLLSWDRYSLTKVHSYTHDPSLLLGSIKIVLILVLLHRIGTYAEFFFIIFIPSF